MQFITLFGTACGLSMDAFAAAMCLGLNLKKFRLRDAVITGLYFGVFQALMPLIGYYLGIYFSDFIKAYDHWVAFTILSILGLKMIYESMGEEENTKKNIRDVCAMLMLAVGTSIDALAVGISFAMLGTNIFSAIFLIGMVTFLLSAMGVKIGNVFGKKYKRLAELFGGIILIAIGIKILAEHLMG